MSGRAKVRDLALQGPGRDDGTSAQGNHHGPEEAHAAARDAGRRDARPTPARIVEQLMGNKPEERFNFISERAEFVSAEGLDI